MLLSSAVKNYVSDLGELFAPSTGARNFYENQIALAAQTLLGDEVVGFIGMGYPFYAYKGTDSLIPVKEISRFLEDIKTKAELSEAGNFDLANYTIGYSKREVQGIPSLSELDLVRALPDLDIAVIVNHFDHDTVANLQKRLSDAEFCGSEPTLEKLFSRTQNLREQLGGAEGNSGLPVDCSIWQKDDLLETLAAIRKGRILSRMPYQSFKDQWRAPIEKKCVLAADLLFSATPIANYTDALIRSEILQTQKYLSDLFQGARLDLLASILKLRNDRVGRTLKDPEIMTNLKDRMSQFREYDSQA